MTHRLSILLSPCLLIGFYYILHGKYCRKPKSSPFFFFAELVLWLMAESLWKIARDARLLILLSGSCVKRCSSGSFVWPICLSMALHLEIWLGWTERALAVPTASLWLAFANPGEFMKCAEDVTLIPIHFINELLRKLISRPGPWRCPGTCLRGTKCHGK